MKHVIRKYYMNFEREEKWLNALAAKGLAMTGYSWCRYVFEDSQPGEYIYRIELLDHPATHPESRRYIAFAEETGAECVATYMRWVYFRKKAADGPFELYSDNTSRIAHYRRARAFYFALLMMELSVSVFNLVVGLIPRVAIINLVCAGVIAIAAALFTVPWVQMTLHIRRLRREQKITES